MTDREFYQSIKICPNCHKEKLYGQEKECLMCRAYKYTNLIRFRESHPNYSKEKMKTRYYLRISLHRCTQCNKQLEDDYEYRM